MPLSQSQKFIWQKARASRGGGLASGLDDGVCAYLIARIAKDLNLATVLSGFPTHVENFFFDGDLASLRIERINALEKYEELLSEEPDGDMFFACLAALHKARLKYEAILKYQPLPTLEQVGPRGLLQYGKLEARSLAGFLFWRKWFFDIDNRAGQETGYLFEPVIANAVGGTPVSAGKSPVKRRRDFRKGRQIDCLLDEKAYELKIRMTIAASGQGRWGEELDFPGDCEASGYVPVLLVLDSTPNAKLSVLASVFRKHGGSVYIGTDAWEHLESLAGPVMSLFLENYIRRPMEHLLTDAPRGFPEFSAHADGDGMVFKIDGHELSFSRANSGESGDGHDTCPGDGSPGI